MSGSVDFTLARDPNAVAQARRLVAELCAAEPDREDLDRAKLLVSELVTNALVHGQGMITLRVDLDEDRLLVEVIDEGSGLEQVIRQTDPKRPGGWGLSIVDAEASRWGVHEGLAHVWFEVERPGPRIANNKHPAHSGL
jgi:anti-sigma regulatory factor (Ser/Thr protein kinase)